MEPDKYMIFSDLKICFWFFFLRQMKHKQILYSFFLLNYLCFASALICWLIYLWLSSLFQTGT